MHQFLRHGNIKKVAVGYTVLILLLVALPINGEDQFLGRLNDNYVLQIRFDYISHVLMFVPWVLIGAYGWQLQRKSSIRIALSFVLALLFAVLCEYLQLLLPYRTFNINDLMSNSLGVLLGFLLFWAWVRSSKS